MIGRNDDCFCGSGKKWKKCHFPQTGSEVVLSKEFLERAELYRKRYGIILKTPEQIDGIRKASHLTARILDEVAAEARAGVTTNTLDKLAYEKILQAGGIPASLHYGSPPFPKSICTSLNEVICHGIPNDIPLKDGDIVNIDVAVILDGYFGDCSKMVAIGKVSPDKKLVFDTSLACLKEATKIVRPGLLLNKIGDVIQDIAEKAGCSVVNQFVGHGVGIKYHEAPQVHHCRSNLAIPLTSGMIFTIEPMINAGVLEAVIDKKDKWTARTKDLKPSAQWEYELLVTDTGVEILTPWIETTCS
jgi:methionyl aminopeptidase